ncbi:MAG: DUF4446 family protein [Lachnospiraceae bacterium]|nr:DUF4446 family protein [Lachnospiraceae bacterium]
MDSKLFHLGFDPIFLIIVIGVFAVAALVVGLIVLWKSVKIWKRYDRFMRGRDTQSLEEVIHQLLANVEMLMDRQENIIKSVEKLTTEHNNSFKKHALLKYNAFKEVGGKLSFSLAMLTEDNDGFILTCMHANGPSYTYLKEILGGESYVGLSTEEQQVLDEALHFEAL